ncbi:hypothetical protein C8R45DRAFT_936083 [Mycena sanguinolenta]|nr:hypothetical protein C8R45DRAFT_936083 [Mycena sanguinolenta]
MSLAPCVDLVQVRAGNGTLLEDDGAGGEDVMVASDGRGNHDGEWWVWACVEKAWVLGDKTETSSMGLCGEGAGSLVQLQACDKCRDGLERGEVCCGPTAESRPNAMYSSDWAFGETLQTQTCMTRAERVVGALSLKSCLPPVVVGKFGSDFRFKLELNRTEHEVQVRTPNLMPKFSAYSVNRSASHTIEREIAPHDVTWMAKEHDMLRAVSRHSKKLAAKDAAKHIVAELDEEHYGFPADVIEMMELDGDEYIM